MTGLEVQHLGCKLRLSTLLICDTLNLTWDWQAEVAQEEGLVEDFGGLQGRRA